MLSLERHEAAALREWVARGYPRETCGLLVGRRERGRTDVVRVVLGRNRNVERPHDRYELDPRDLLAAEEEARRDALEVVGVWHSHPDHPAEPSEVDRRTAWEGWSYVIASVGAGGVRALRSWRLEGDRFVEEPLEEGAAP